MATACEILVTIEDDAWEDALAGVEGLALRAAEAAIAGALADDLYEIPAGPKELSVVLADDETVRALNRDYRGKDRPTNVLSFALHADADHPDEEYPDGEYPDGEHDAESGDRESLAEDGPPPVLSNPPTVLGDVILAYGTVVREAAEQGKPLAHHLTHLIVHGVLHLIGYDHIADDEADEMERLETRILSSLDIPDPYAGGDARAPDEPEPDGPGGAAAGKAPTNLT